MADIYHDCLYPTVLSVKGHEIYSPSAGYFKHSQTEINQEIYLLDIAVLLHTVQRRPNCANHFPSFWQLLLRQNVCFSEATNAVLIPSIDEMMKEPLCNRRSIL